MDPKDGQGENKTFLDPALDLLRHKPGDGKESEKEISISAGTQPPRSVPRLSSNLCASFLRSKLKVGANAGYKSWLPYHPLPLDAVEKYKEKKDPWEKVSPPCQNASAPFQSKSMLLTLCLAAGQQF